jgi:predicted metalloenzyme YecM
MPHVEADQLPNPTIVLRLRKGLAVKFHPKSIKEIVRAR